MVAQSLQHRPKVDCSGVKKEELLAELVNSAKPLGMGWKQANPKPLTVADIAKYLAQHGLSLDYVNGRPIKVSLHTWPLVDPSGYDRDNGDGAFELALARVRNGQAGACPTHSPTALDARILAGLEQVEIEAADAPGLAVNDLALSQFDTCYFTPTFANELRARGLPYPDEWCMFMGHQNGKARFTGSLGGSFTVDPAARVLSRCLIK
jgi:hypothetical protein